MDIKRVFYWADFTIVLAWIRKESRNLKMFVANRVSIIREIDQWDDVPSEQNPAEIISRKFDPDKIQERDLLWFELFFLQKCVMKFPSACIDVSNSESY